MHPNPAFRHADTDTNLAFARARGFGVLCVNAPDGPQLAHIPFLLAVDGATARLHLVRSNPIARLPDGPAVIAVSGPDGYVSPDWYGVEDQVPTWNYVAVHLRGTLTRRPDAEMRGLLDAQSGHFEDQLTPKRPWTTDKMTPEVLERMMRQIVPFTLQITDVQGTWKLNQNKPGVARHGAAEAMHAHGTGSEVQDLAALMHGGDGQKNGA